MNQVGSFLIKAALVIILVVLRVPALRDAMRKAAGQEAATGPAEPPHRLPTGPGFYAPAEPRFGQTFEPPSAGPVGGGPAWNAPDRPGRRALPTRGEYPAFSVHWAPRSR